MKTLTLEDRIEELMRSMGWDAARVAVVAKVSNSAVSQWLGHGSKTINSIGKIEAAIFLERESGFSALWLAKGIGAKKVAEADSAARGEVAWPFPRVKYERWLACDERDRGYVEGAVSKALSECEEARRGGAQQSATGS